MKFNVKDTISDNDNVKVLEIWEGHHNPNSDQKFLTKTYRKQFTSQLIFESFLSHMDTNFHMLLNFEKFWKFKFVIGIALVSVSSAIFYYLIAFLMLYISWIRSEKFCFIFVKLIIILFCRITRSNVCFRVQKIAITMVLFLEKLILKSLSQPVLD